MEPQLLTFERQAQIRALLARDGRVLAAGLAEIFRVSEDTVRRDLREMADAGLCQRVYGGAVPAAPDEGSLSERRGKALGRKGALAIAVARTIEPGSMLFIDAGSTNLAVAEALPENSRLTVVTNAPAIACVLLERRGFETILLGGRVDPQTGACFGPKALADAALFRPDVLVLGACGVDAEHGVTGHVFEESELKAAIASRSRQILVAATTDKLGTASPYGVVPVERISLLFVEHDCPAELLAPFQTAGTPIRHADPEPADAPAPTRRRARN